MNKRILDLALKHGATHKQSLGVYQFYEGELEAFVRSIIQDNIETIDRTAILEWEESVGELYINALKEDWEIKR